MNNDIRPMTPEEIISEWKKMLPAIDPKSFKDMGLGQIMTADLINATFIQYYEDFLRSSLRALLLHVGESFPKKYNYAEAGEYAGYDHALDDCKRVLDKMIEEI